MGACQLMRQGGLRGWAGFGFVAMGDGAGVIMRGWGKRRVGGAWRGYVMAAGGIHGPAPSRACGAIFRGVVWVQGRDKRKPPPSFQGGGAVVLGLG